MMVFKLFAGSLVMMLVVILTSLVIMRHSKFYQGELARTGGREVTLDGLRGLAALMVAVCHAGMVSLWIKSGQWLAVRPNVLQSFGSIGVIFFFMLTGYLFWGKARKANGKINPLKLWRGRLYRIAPLYLFSVGLMVLLLLAETGHGWLAFKYIKPMLRILSLGVLCWWPVGPANPLDYNGAVWTLQFEWQFYLLLPFIAWVATGNRTYIGILIFLGAYVYHWVLIFFWPGLDWHSATMDIWWFFVFGILSSALLENQKAASVLRHPLVAVIVFCASVFWCCLQRQFFPSVSLAAGLFPTFLVAAAGNGFGGLLTHPVTRCLGAISFSLYLLHFMVFRLVFWLATAGGWGWMPSIIHWLILTVALVAVTILSAFTYRWIEFPFLSANRKLNTQSLKEPS